MSDPGDSGAPKARAGRIGPSAERRPFVTCAACGARGILVETPCGAHVEHVEGDAVNDCVIIRRCETALAPVAWAILERLTCAVVLELAGRALYRQALQKGGTFACGCKAGRPCLRTAERNRRGRPVRTQRGLGDPPAPPTQPSQRGGA